VTGFVDLHTHVIPSGDDGAPNIEAGLELCREMAADGTRVVYGTPHAHPPDSWFPITEERVALARRNHAVMKPRCAEFGLDLRLGWELAATGVLVGDLGDYVLEGTRAILLELPGPWFSFDDEVAVTREQAAAIRAAGLEVVLAHPERSLGVQRRPELLLELVEEGAFVCFNADSFVGGHGEACEQCGWRLLELGIGDFVASDAHRSERPSRLREAVEAIAARHGDQRSLALAQGDALERLARSRLP
jgi:protein-tyrosine phosphatase